MAVILCGGRLALYIEAETWEVPFHLDSDSNADNFSPTILRKVLNSTQILITNDLTFDIIIIIIHLRNYFPHHLVSPIV